MCGDEEDAENDVDIGFLCIARRATDADFVCDARRSSNRVREAWGLCVRCVCVSVKCSARLVVRWSLLTHAGPCPLSVPQMQYVYESSQPGASLKASLDELFGYASGLGQGE